MNGILSINFHKVRTLSKQEEENAPFWTFLTFKSYHNWKTNHFVYNVRQLQNEELTLVCDKAIQYAKQDDFRNNVQKQNLIKQAILNVVDDEEQTLNIYSIIENNSEDY